MFCCVLVLLLIDGTERKEEASGAVQSGGAAPPSSQFIPYRDSTLTRVLQPSLEGNCVNFVFLCISNDSNASIAQGLRMTMELRGMLQHIER